MKTYTYSEARNRLAEVLDEAKRQEVVIRRRRGDVFAVVPKSRQRRSPFDVPGLDKNIGRAELLAAIRESRKRHSRTAGRKRAGRRAAGS